MNKINTKYRNYLIRVNGLDDFNRKQNKLLSIGYSWVNGTNNPKNYSICEAIFLEFCDMSLIKDYELFSRYQSAITITEKELMQGYMDE